jgi:hypothetical protein
VRACDAVGVPDTTPVVVLKLKPAGRAGTIENDFVRVNSASVYAVVAVIAVPTVAVTVCVAGEMLGAADTIDDPTGAATTPASATAPATTSRPTTDKREDMGSLLGVGGDTDVDRNGQHICFGVATTVGQRRTRVVHLDDARRAPNPCNGA